MIERTELQSNFQMTWGDFSIVHDCNLKVTDEATYLENDYYIILFW